jgi:predicted methyltransferase
VLFPVHGGPLTIIITGAGVRRGCFTSQFYKIARKLEAGKHSRGKAVFHTAGGVSFLPVVHLPRHRKILLATVNMGRTYVL